MRLRRDALAGAAELVLEVERLAQETDGLTATVGRITVEPNVGNVIAGRARFSYDVRHQDGDIRTGARDRIEQAARDIAGRRGLELDWSPRDDISPVPMSPRVRELLARACGEAGVPAFELPSGAGHDAMTASNLTPEVGMLFVRCKDGISHNPAESVRADDVAVALDVVVHFLGLRGKPSRRDGRRGS